MSCLKTQHWRNWACALLRGSKPFLAPARASPACTRKPVLGLGIYQTPPHLLCEGLPGPQEWCMTAGSSNGQERSALWVVAFFPGRGGQSFRVSSHACLDGG